MLKLNLTQFNLIMLNCKILYYSIIFDICQVDSDYQLNLYIESLYYNISLLKRN
nr:MAG TPA: hypothetical protein [Caudoviricetes sp.]